MKAVVFVDVQKDFIDGKVKCPKANEVMPKIVGFAKKCVTNGYKIYATRDTHEKTTWNSIVDKMNSVYTGGYLTTLEGKKLPVEHCIEGTDGWMIDDKLYEAIEGNVTIINKSTFGSFDLADVIQEDSEGNIDEIIVVGNDIVSDALILRTKFPNTPITVMKNLCFSENDNYFTFGALDHQLVDVKF